MPIRSLHKEPFHVRDPPHPPPPPTPTKALEALDKARQACSRVKAEIHKTIVGQDEVVDQTLTAIFCKGHAVVVGVPGLAKTLLISTIAKTMSLGFSRIQFTPDLMPSDITGTEVIEEDKATGSRELRFVKGPVFANVILADEINRTPPKTQAALLEAMQEHQVTVGGIQHKLPNPFFVLATQNPIEQEGTYPLPEAQLDRFMYQILIGYPSRDEEFQIIKHTDSRITNEIQTVLTAADIHAVHKVIRAMPVADHIINYALSLVRATRVSEPDGEVLTKPAIVRDYLAWGAGPRASEYLILAAKAVATLSGDDHVTPDHIKEVAKPVLRHRILTNFNAQADRITTDSIIDELLNTIPISSASPAQNAQLDKVIQ